MSSKDVKKYIIEKGGRALKDALISLAVAIALDSLKTLTDKNRK